MKAPLVVGYKGEIGSFILQCLLKIMPKALDIYAFDISETIEECKERILKSDVIFLCVPLERTSKFFMDFHKELQGKTVIEQTSLKCVLFEDIGIKPFLKGINILSMHLLFRPSATPDINDRHVILINRDKWMNSFPGYYKLGYQMVLLFNSGTLSYLLTWKDHDKEMATQQALVHKVLLTLDKCIPFGETYMSKKVKELATRIKKGNSKLYAQIQKSKYTDKVTNDFINKLSKFKIGE